MIHKEANQIELNTELYLPPEVMENIVRYLDGKSMLKYISLSETCNAIAINALRNNKTFWKKLCINEIPKKYLTDLINKHFGACISLVTFSEIQCQVIYEHWSTWQNAVFNITQIGRKTFLDKDKINKIICNEFDVLAIFAGHKCVFSLINNENTESHTIKINTTEKKLPNTLVILNPQHQTNTEYDNDENDRYKYYTTFHQYHTNNICPLHHMICDLHHQADTNCRITKIIGVDINIYLNTCCWVREEWYEWHSFDPLSENGIKKIVGRYCANLFNIMFMSVVYGLIISQKPNNCIEIINIYRKVSIPVKSWLNCKYIGASAVYIYMNILFIGTKSGYLLAYRLQCFDDLINLKENNILLETKLDIGEIIKIDIMDFKNLCAIIVASVSSIVWIKVI